MDRAAIERIAAEVLARFGRIDALVNAAGTNIPERSLEKMTEAQYSEVFDVNLTEALNTIQAFLPAMRQQQGGTIVNINSIATELLGFVGASYVMSKFAGGVDAIDQRGRGEEQHPGDVDFSGGH